MYPVITVKAESRRNSIYGFKNVAITWICLPHHCIFCVSRNDCKINKWVTVPNWKLLLLMLVFCPTMCSLLKENLERLMLCLLIAHCCCFLFLVAKSCWFSGTSSHYLPGNDQNLIILYRSIHPLTCLQSKFCDAFWVYWYKNQVIYAHISYLAVKVPSCSCSSNAPSCLNSKITTYVP